VHQWAGRCPEIKIGYPVVDLELDLLPTLAGLPVADPKIGLGFPVADSKTGLDSQLGLEGELVQEQEQGLDQTPNL
jgi:hypothetical protein